MIKRMMMALAMSVALPGAAFSQTVHAVLVADTTDATIGEGTKGNLQRMQKLLRSISKVGGFAIEQHVVAGDDFSCGNISKAISGLSIGKDDTVFFYYSAHGYRTPKTPTRFPDFDCSRGADQPGSVLGTSAVVEQLTGAGAKFVIAVADTCNVLLSRPPQGFSSRSAPLVNREAWRRLFLRYRGTVIMSGSAPTKPSWYLIGDEAGGLFSYQFMNAIADTMSDVSDADNPELARWSTIVNRSIKPIVADAEHGQEPQGARIRLTVDPKLP